MISEIFLDYDLMKTKQKGENYAEIKWVEMVKSLGMHFKGLFKFELGG